MKTQPLCASLIAVLALGLMTLVPVAAGAQQHGDQKKQQGQNRDWVKSGHGNMNTPYSSARMNHDRKSHDEGDKARARIYSQQSFMHNGKRYIRHSQKENGKLSFTFKIG